MRLAALAYERAIWPHLGAAFASSALNDFYNRGANRLMAYLCLTFLAGLATLLALEIYGVLFQMLPSPLTFRGVYAWETAINFGFCHFLIDEGSFRLGAYWQVLKTRTFSRSWLIWSMAFALFMILQRTVVYERTIHYHPTIVQFYSSFPDARPDFFSMVFFCFPFWLIITTLTRLLILTSQSRCTSAISKTCQACSTPRQETPLPSKALVTEPPLSPSTAALVVNSGGQKVLIQPETITHISVEDHYCRFYVSVNETKKQVLALTSLKAVVKQLPSQAFVQIHRSHVIRLAAVGSIQRKGRSYYVRVGTNDQFLPISRKRQGQCLGTIKQHLEVGSILDGDASDRTI